MNLHRISLLLIAALALAACNKKPPAEAEKTVAPADSIATVNGQAIGRSEFDLYVDTVQRQGGRDAASIDRSQLLDQYIGMKLAADAAEKESLAKDPKVADQIAQARMNVLVDAHVQAWLKTHPATEEEMKKEYDEQVAKLPREYHARHILVDDKAVADAITKLLQNGADFAKLAKQKSKDASGKSGGDLGWFTPDAMVKPFSDAVVALQPGQMTAEPVQSQFGWHIIKLDETRATAAPPYEDVKDRVKMIVERKKLQTYIEDLRKNAKIEKKA
jgi:peptidyl-prolyl cis-trans isomerase C